MPLLLSFIVPAMAMRLIAEEKGSGSLEMLITMPVRDWQSSSGSFWGHDPAGDPGGLTISTRHGGAGWAA